MLYSYIKGKIQCQCKCGVNSKKFEDTPEDDEKFALFIEKHLGGCEGVSSS
jgi:hypothetical protein